MQRNSGGVKSARKPIDGRRIQFAVNNHSKNQVKKSSVQRFNVIQESDEELDASKDILIDFSTRNSSDLDINDHELKKHDASTDIRAITPVIINNGLYIESSDSEDVLVRNFKQDYCDQHNSPELGSAECCQSWCDFDNSDSEDFKRYCAKHANLYQRDHMKTISQKIHDRQAVLEAIQKKFEESPVPLVEAIARPKRLLAIESSESDVEIKKPRMKSKISTRLDSKHPPRLSLIESSDSESAKQKPNVNSTDKNAIELDFFDTTDDEIPASRPRLKQKASEIVSILSSSDDESIKRSKPKRVTRSMNSEPEILKIISDTETPSEEESVVKRDKRKKKRNHRETHRQLIEVNSESEEDALSDGKLGYDTDESAIVESNFLYCRPCMEYQPIDNFSVREQKTPRYGEDKRFCLKHQSWIGEQSHYQEEIESALQARQNELVAEDRIYGVDYHVGSSEYESDDFIVN